MSLVEQVKNKIQYVSENQNTFEYWLENTFILFFLREKGNYFHKDATVNVHIELPSSRLEKWGMTGYDVRKYLEKEGFTIIESENIQEQYRECHFKVSFDGMDEFLKSNFDIVKKF